MKIFVLLFYIFIKTDCVISLLENQCNLKFSVDGRNDFNTIISPTDPTCFKTTSCKIKGRNSFCSDLYHSHHYHFNIEKLEIQQINRDLWIQVILTSSYLQDLNQQENLSRLIVRISFDEDNTCYNFMLFQHTQNYIMLPYIQIPSAFKKKGRLQLSLSNKSIAEDNEELISIQAIEYSLQNLDLSRKIELSNIKFQYSFKEDILHLSSNLNCSLFYNVSIHESVHHKICDTQSSALCQKYSILRNNDISIDCEKWRFKSCQMYCIHVHIHPFKSCGSMFPKNLIEVTFLKMRGESYYNDSTKSACKLWDADIHVKNDSLASSIAVQFSPIPEFLQCFQFYEIYLYKLWTATCNPYLGVQIRKFRVTKLRNKQGMATFNSLMHGNYCALITPLNSYNRFESWSLNTNTVEIYAMKEITKSKHDNGKFPTEVIIAALLIFCICCLGLIYYVKQKQRNKYGTVSVDEDNKYTQSESIRLTSEATQVHLNECPVVVYIFYSGEKVIREDVSVLKNFLEAGDHYKVITIEEMLPLAIIMNEDDEWAKSIFNYECPKKGDEGNSNKRFIFINSKQDIQGANTIVSQAFSCALNYILKDEKKSQDNCHLFVTSVGPRGNGNTEKLVIDSIHYRIPEELIEFGLYLNSKITQI